MKKKIRILFILILMFFTLFNPKLVRAEEEEKPQESEYYTNLDQEEVKKITGLTVDNIAHAWQWITDNKTYIIIEENNGNIIYWWNAPNLQQATVNSILDEISKFGYGAPITQLPWTKYRYTNLKDEYASNAKTAMSQLGFNIPNYYYKGEYPLLYISAINVILPDGFWDGVQRTWQFVTTGTLIPAPNKSDLNTLTYLAPGDYSSSDLSFRAWLNKNWDKFVDTVEDGQILHSKADTNGVYDDAQYSKEAILKAITPEDQLANYKEYVKGLKPNEIIRLLQRFTGKNFIEVSTNIVLVTTGSSKKNIKRIMPYELETMNNNDKNLLSNIVDHRATYGNIQIGPFQFQIGRNILKTVVDVSSWLAETSVFLNRIASFNFFNNFIKLDKFWSNEITTQLFILMVVGFVCYMLWEAIQIGILRTKDLFASMKRILTRFLILMIIYVIVFNPANFYSKFVSFYNTVTDISNVTLKQDEVVSELYGKEASEEEISNAKMWLPYFDTWTSFHTSHGLESNSQIVNFTAEIAEPETKDMTPITIGGVQQTKWSVYLASYFQSGGLLTGDAYRIVDHFMAPRVTAPTLDKETHTFSGLKVVQNENYTTDIQSTVKATNVTFQLLILISIVIKVFVFVEIFMSLLLMTITFASEFANPKKIKGYFSSLFGLTVDILIINTITSILTYSSLLATGNAALLLFLFYLYVLIKGFKYWISSDTIFRPKFIKSIVNYLYKLGAKYSSTGGII